MDDEQRQGDFQRMFALNSLLTCEPLLKGKRLFEKSAVRVAR